MSVLIIDFGSQYTLLIAKTLQSLKVSYAIKPYTKVLEIDVSNENIRGLILSGGPQSVSDLSSEHQRPDWFGITRQQKIPVLGVCFGLQWLVNYFGGQVESLQPKGKGEFGSTKLVATSDVYQSRLFGIVAPPVLEGFKEGVVCWMSHYDIATKLPGMFITTAKTVDSPHAVIESHIDGGVFATQYHPEVDHTDKMLGAELYKRFIFDICKCEKGSERSQKRIDTLKAQIMNTLRDDENDILLALSGGVDSSVLCHLLYRTVPGRLKCVFVNHGYMRKGESKQICERFKFLGDKFHYCDAKREFRKALQGVCDPERKRKIIGKLFIDTFENVVNTNESFKNVHWLAQGTIYPDIIESSGMNGTAHTIKSHHNVGGLPERMKLKLLEPLKFMFKDQVRVVGELLGIPKKYILRHPFPGPGLAIRILGVPKLKYVKILKCADKIFIDMLKESGVYTEISQAFAGFIPIKTVGVKGDQRSYGWTIVLRAVNTKDFMTATISKHDLSLDFLEKVATKIVAGCNGVVGRVLFDITSKPPGTIELE